MFYEATMDRFLRFGDVVRGYITAPPSIERPIFNISQVRYFCSINVEVPVFSVVVTPCCSIEDKMVSLTPLIQLKNSFFKNTYFIEDFTIINKEIECLKCFPPDEWEKLSPAEREENEARAKPYAFLSLFVYEKNELFPEYTVRKQKTNYYMIDFRNVQTIKCDMIKRAEEMGLEESPIIESKCLQLSNTSREELRNKMAYYYGRSPEEDIAERVSLTK